MRTNDIRLLVKGLSSIAITALSVEPGTAALVALSTEVAANVVERRVPAQRLQRTVMDGLMAWAESEKLQDALEPGIVIADLAIRRHGLLLSQLRECSFDGERITAEIITRARSSDRDWGAYSGDDADEVHAVARRALEVTVAVILRERHRIESEVLPLLTEEFAHLDRQLVGIRSSFSATSDSVRALESSLIETASLVDLKAYLEQRIEDWDVAGWIQSAGRSVIRPSQIERTLHLQEKGTTVSRIPIAQALRKYPNLVILGGPGAGKSWLAKRVAREAAMAALAALDSGADPSDVEIPLFTTWEAWTKQSAGDPRGALIEASFGAGLGHSDIGGAQRTERLKRFFGAASRAITVVDSLDEARNRSETESRIRELHHIEGWRTVVTSRPSAWTEKRALRELEDGVAVIEPLSWKTDVAPFVREWFAEDPARATALTEQLLRTAHLRQTSTIPLLLSFYCLFAQSAPPDAPLPSTDHELFEKVVHELLVSEWATGERPHDVDVTEAKRILSRWAWNAVEDASTGSGLGHWGEHLRPQGHVPDRVQRILDNVAPSVIDGDNRQVRTFRHRTLLEHFVAVHIATFTPVRAVEALLPHLWFDPDWEVAAPRAIALHPKRDEVRTLLLGAAPAALDSRLAASADAQLDTFWSHVMADTSPGDWPEKHRADLHRLRVRLAEDRPVLVAASTQWSDSEPAVIGAITRRLSATASPSLPDLERWIRALPRLAVGSQERRIALRAVTNNLVESDVSSVEDLDMYFHLDPTPDECNDLRESILGAAADREVGGLGYQFQLLLHLDPTPDQRRAARRGIVESLAEADPWTLGVMVSTLAALDPSPADRRSARDAITAALTTVGPWLGCLLVTLEPGRLDHRFLLYIIDTTTVSGLASVLVSFDPSPEERNIAIRALTLAATGEAGDDGLAAESLSTLSITNDERRGLRADLAAALTTIDPWGVGQLAAALVSLGPTPEERRIALDAISKAFAGDDEPWFVGRTMDTYAQLHPSPEDLRALHDSLAVALSSGRPRLIGQAVDALASLDPTPDERRAAVHSVIAVLEGDGSTRLWAVASSLHHLDPGRGDRAGLRRALAQVLSTDEPQSLSDLVRALSLLDPEESERRSGIEAITRALGRGYVWEFSDLIATLMRLVRTEEDRRGAATTLTAALTTTDPMHLRPLTEALLRLFPSVEDRRAVFETILFALGNAETQHLRHLTRAVLPLVDSAEDRRIAVATVLAVLPRASPNDAFSLAATIRRMSTPEDWLRLLHEEGSEHTQA